MQGIISNKPQFHPKLLKPESFSCRFLADCVQFLKLKKLKNKQTSFAVCYFEQKNALFCYKNIKIDPDDSAIEKKSNFNVPHAMFWVS